MKTESLIATIDHIQSQEQGIVEVEISLDNPQVDLSELMQCSATDMPSIDVGQDGNCRWPCADGRSLHAHWFTEARIVRFHVDRTDPRKNPIGHLWHDTGLVKGFLAGTAVGKATGVFRVKQSIWPTVLFGVAGAIANHGRKWASRSRWRVTGESRHGEILVVALKSKVHRLGYEIVCPV